MKSLTALEIFDYLKVYYQNEAELLRDLFDGKFSYSGAKGQNVTVQLSYDIRKPRIFNIETGNLKSKWHRGIVAEGKNIDQFLSNIDNVIQRIREPNIPVLLGLLTERAKQLELLQYIPCETSQQIRCRNLAFILFMRAIGGPVNHLVQNKTECTDYSLHSNCPRPDLVATKIKGYVDEMRHVCNQLAQYNNKAALVGMSGVGKSELAKAIAEEQSSVFTTCLWVPFTNSLLETITNDNLFPIWGCSRENFQKDTDRQYFERKMRILKALADRQVLIIIDGFNVADDDDLKDFLSGEYAVLFTTQYRPRAGNLPIFEITNFKEETKQLALFKTMYKMHLTDDEVNDVRKIINLLGGHTQGICVVASTMRCEGISPNKMYEILRTTEAEPMDETGIYKKLQKIFSHIKLSCDEQYVMCNLALIPEAGISIKEFCEWLQMRARKVILGLIERCLIVHDSYKDIVHLHPLIMRLLLSRVEEQPNICCNLVNNLVNACKNAFDCNYARKLELLGYIQSIYDKTSNLPDVQLIVGMQLGNILEMIGKYRLSVDVYKQLRENTANSSLHVVLNSKIAHSLLLAGNLNEGYLVALEGHDLFQSLPKEQIDEQVQRADNWLLQRLCEYYRWIGNYEVAKVYGCDAVGLLQSNSKESAWDIGWSKYHLAYVYLLKGEISDCIQHLNDAILLFNEIGSEYSSAFAMELLGQAYMLKEDYPKALDLTISAGSILHRFLDPNHADCGRNWVCQGNIRRRIGQNEEALECYSKAINVFHNSYEAKAGLIEALLHNNEIILDLWGEAFQLDNS